MEKNMNEKYDNLSKKEYKRLEQIAREINLIWASGINIDKTKLSYSKEDIEMIEYMKKNVW